METGVLDVAVAFRAEYGRAVSVTLIARRTRSSFHGPGPPTGQHSGSDRARLGS